MILFFVISRLSFNSCLGFCSFSCLFCFISWHCFYFIFYLTFCLVFLFCFPSISLLVCFSFYNLALFHFVMCCFSFLCCTLSQLFEVEWPHICSALIPKNSQRSGPSESDIDTSPLPQHHCSKRTALGKTPWSKHFGQLGPCWTQSEHQGRPEALLHSNIQARHL